MIGLRRDQEDFYDEKGDSLVEDCIPKNTIDKICKNFFRLKERARNFMCCLW